MKHSGCPAGWLLFLRSVQLILAFGVLGLASYFLAVEHSDPDYAYEVALAAMTICWVFISFVLFCINKLLPLVVVIVDAIMLVAWATAVGRYLKVYATPLVRSCSRSNYDYYDSDYGDYDYGYYGYDDDYYYDDYYYGDYGDDDYYYGDDWPGYGYGSGSGYGGYDYSYIDSSLFLIRCHLRKTVLGLMVVAMATFIPTIVLAIVAFNRLRNRASAAGAGAGYVIPAAGNNPQVPHYVPVFVPYPYSQQRHPLEPPQPAFDPVGMRYTSPLPQQFYPDPRFSSPPPEEDRPPSSIDPEQGRPPMSTYQYPPRSQQS